MGVKASQKGVERMIYKLIIKGRLDGQNEYIRACRTSPYKGSDMKHDNEAKVMQAIYEQFGRLRIQKPVIMRYAWYEKNTRRDLDNISSFGRKVIQDALVKTKILQNDGWANIKGFLDRFYVDKENPRIEVEIEVIE